MLKKISLVAYFGLALLLMNCKGDDGAVGPAGAAGAKGDTGATGPAGAKGDTGVSGAARYYASGIDTTDAKGFFYKVIEAKTAADEAFWEEAVVLAFVKTNGVYWSLPGTVSFPGGAESTFGYYHGYSEKVFYAEIFQKDWTGKTAENTVPPARIVQDVRIVAIPASAMRMSATVNWKSLDETLKALGLSESDLKVL
ncbi:hypothetical protein [Dyadobacter sp. CY312]|uniref:hypothetical protein n=1 Tax=Dyadobacter sp. CY312 TaxID=2907303 RepID=UPI001F384A84|nr:hypothetical protein [Dyadobacter sp. CY312]MCE7043332.1 hypothetical protein [Dyadobacter sp. CY312]